MSHSTKYYMKLTISDFKAVHQGYGIWMITYTYPAGRKISAILNAMAYDIINDIDSTQRKLKWVKDVIKNKNLG